MRLLSSIATSITILSFVPIVHCNPQVPSPSLADTIDHDPNSLQRELQMDKPWGEMQKGSESKQVLPLDRELKKKKRKEKKKNHSKKQKNKKEQKKKQNKKKKKRSQKTRRSSKSNKSSQPTSSPTLMKQVAVRSVLVLDYSSQTRKLRELQGLGGLSPDTVTALESTILTLLTGGGLDVDSVTITDISDVDGVLEITYKAILNVTPDTTEQEVQEQAVEQLEASLDENACGDNCFSTELQTSISEVGVGDDCGGITCEELLNADVDLSTAAPTLSPTISPTLKPTNSPSMMSGVTRTRRLPRIKGKSNKQIQPHHQKGKKSIQVEHVQNPKQCWRQCPAHVMNKNIIVLDHYGSAGLNDRAWLFEQIVQLAGYLCATVRVPPPRTMLSDEHNLGSFLPKETKWTDLLDIRFKRDGSAALLEYDTDEFDESNPISPYHLDQYFTDEEYSDWLRLSFSDKTSDHEKEALDIVKQLEDFTKKQIEDPSFSQGFIWESKQDFNWFDHLPLLKDYFQGREEKLDVGQTSAFPFASCPYTYDAPSVATHVADLVFDGLKESNPDTDHFGMLHIRRGDAKDECDTSLIKISNYLSCSLENLEVYGKVSVLFTSDEQNVCYRNAIQDMVESLGFHFIDLDSYVMTTVSQYTKTLPSDTAPSRLENNMFVFKVEKEMEWHVDMTFRMNQRRSMECSSCDKLASSWQFEDTQVIASNSNLKAVIDFPNVLQSYNTCATTTAKQL